MLPGCQFRIFLLEIILSFISKHCPIYIGINYHFIVFQQFNVIFIPELHFDTGIVVIIAARVGDTTVEHMFGFWESEIRLD